ncbi:hypothetical protein N9046_08745 [Akkermansiaceae bacterium]|nr:hypothetical protein [Akkermansiaceae bacterium]
MQRGSQLIRYELLPNLSSEIREGEIEIISSVFQKEWASQIGRNQVGHTSLCISKNADDYGNIYVCYQTSANTAPLGELRLLTRKSGSNVWNDELIDAVNTQDFEVLKCRVGSKYVLGVVYSDWVNKKTKFAYKKEDGWIFEDIADGEGIAISFSEDRYGNLAAAFLKDGSLTYSYRADGAWVNEMIDSVERNTYVLNSTGGIQRAISLCFSPINEPYVAFSSSSKKLVLAVKRNGRWNFEIISDVNWERATALPSLEFDRAGQPSIAFYNRGNDSEGGGDTLLMFAKKNSDGWGISEVARHDYDQLRITTRCKLKYNQEGFPVIVYHVLRGAGDSILQIVNFDGVIWTSDYIVDGGRNLDFDFIESSENSPEKIVISQLEGASNNLKITEQLIKNGKKDSVLQKNLVRYLIPLDESQKDNWTKRSDVYDDSNWRSSEQPLGFEVVNGTLEPFIKTNIQSEMKGVQSSVYLRSKFELNSFEEIENLSIHIRYDDGYVAYLNGNEISRSYMEEDIKFDSSAIRTRGDSVVLSDFKNIEFEEIENYLVKGVNILALQASNWSKNGSDFFIEAKIKEVMPLREEIVQGNIKVIQTSDFKIYNDTDDDSFTDAREVDYGSDPQNDQSFPHSVEPIIAKIGSLGRNYDINIVLPPNIKWTAKSDVPWVKIIGEDTGRGEGGITCSVGRNNSNQLRRAQITIMNPEANENEKSVVHFIEQNPVDVFDDTDGDGLKDVVETNTGVFMSMEDTGTNPLNKDSDNDGVSDSSELGLDRFSLVVGSRTWREALEDAILKGGNLGTFTTDYEMDNALSSVDFNSLGEFRGVWIGATDAEEEGKWQWVTGEEVERGRWAANQPDNFLEADVAEIGAGVSNEPGKIFDVPESVLRDAYLLEVGYPSNPLNPDTDGDGFTDGEEARASTRPDDADDKPEPSPILDNMEITIGETQDNKELLSLNPSHPNGDEVTIEIFDNPDVDQDGVGAFGIVNNKLQINDFDDFDFEVQTSLQLTLRLRSDKSIPVDSLVTIQLIDDRNEDFDGDGIIESVEEDVHGTSDTSVDSDNDGLSDAFEIGYGRFEIVKGIFSWSAAISDAASRGGHLATFPSQSKWDMAIDSLGERPFQNFNRIWIGLSNEGKWSWVDGSDLTYERWGIAQPIRYTKAIVSGTARGRTAGAWYALGINSVTDGYFLELGYPTDPSRADTDNDGVNDKDEIDSGTNPVVADDFFVGDNDRDGWKDEAERLFGSNPGDPESVPDFQLQVEVNDKDEIELLFPGEKGESYQIQFSENLEEWLSLEGLILGSGATIRQVVPMQDNFPFYRIKRN